MVNVLTLSDKTMPLSPPTSCCGNICWALDTHFHSQDLHFKMRNGNFKSEKANPQFKNTKKTQTKQVNVLPIKMTNVKTMIDPCNDKNYLFWL